MRIIFSVCLLFLTIPIFSNQYNNSPITDFLQIETKSGSINAICEVEGSLFFATQTGVEQYLQKQLIAFFPYKELTGKSQNTRPEPVVLFPDEGHGRLYVRDKTGTGYINYCSGTSHPLQSDSETNIPAFPSASDTSEIVINNKAFFYNDTMLWTQDQCSYYSFPTPIWQLTQDSFLSQKNKLVLLAATKRKGIWKLEVDTANDTIVATPWTIQMPDSNKIVTLRSIAYLHKWQTIAIGTMGNGVLLYSHNKKRFFHPVVNLHFKQGKEDKRQHYWAFMKWNNTSSIGGTELGDLVHYDFHSRKQKIVHAGLGDIPIRALEKEAHDTLWIAANLNKRGLLVKTLLNEDSIHHLDTHKLGSPILTIHRLGTKHLIIGTETETRLLINDQLQDTLLNCSSTFIQTGVDHSTLYLGNGTQLFQFDGDQLQDTILFDTATVGTLSYIFEFSSGKFLLCTRDNFFHLARLKGDSLIVSDTFDEGKGMIFFDSNGLPTANHTIYGGVQLSNTIWLSSNYGLIAFDTQKESFDFFSKQATGLPTKEFNTMAFCKLNDSLAVFGSVNGFVIVNTQVTDFIADKRSHKRYQEPQLWRLKPDTRSRDQPFLWTEWQFKKIDTFERIKHEANNRYFVVAPDYSLLEETRLTLQRNPRTKHYLYNGQMISPERLLDGFSLWGKRLKFDLSAGNSKRPYHLIQSEPLDLWLFSAVLLVLLAITYIIWKRRTRETELQKYIDRRRLFLHMGQELLKAIKYEDVFKAIRTITERDLAQIFDCTKFSLYVHEPETNLLRMIGHVDAKTLPHEDNTKFTEVTGIAFDPDATTDDAFPLVYLWQQENQHKLLVNRAATEFYLHHDLKRPRPKRGAATESFLFRKIYVNNVPKAALTIQNEKPDLFLNPERQEEYDDLLEALAGFIGLSLARIEALKAKQNEEAIRLNYQSHSTLYLHQMEAHFFGDVLDTPQRMIIQQLKLPASLKLIVEGFTKDARLLFKDMHKADTSIKLEKEVNLCENYVKIFNQTSPYIRGIKVNFRFSSEISAETAGKEIPSFLLLNLVHNALIYNFDAKKTQLKVQIKSRLTLENHLEIFVEDDGVGFPLEVLSNGVVSSKKTSKKSTETTLAFFDTMKKLFDVGPTLHRQNQKSGGAKVTITFPANYFEKLKTLMTLQTT